MSEAKQHVTNNQFANAWRKLNIHQKSCPTCNLFLRYCNIGLCEDGTKIVNEYIESIKEEVKIDNISRA